MAFVMEKSKWSLISKELAIFFDISNIHFVQNKNYQSPISRLDMDAPIRSVWFLSDRDANLPNEEHNKNPLEYLEFVYTTGSQLL